MAKTLTVASTKIDYKALTRGRTDHFSNIVMIMNFDLYPLSR